VIRNSIPTINRLQRQYHRILKRSASRGKVVETLGGGLCEVGKGVSALQSASINRRGEVQV
jgi:hypothetical protein